MPADVIMPALELAQATSKVLWWPKAAVDRVAKGDPIVEIRDRQGDGGDRGAGGRIPRRDLRA